MKTINHTASLASITDQPLKRILARRWAELGAHAESAARFMIVQPFDTLDDVEAAIGFPLVVEDTPSWEWVEHHDGGWTEVVFIFSDDAPADVLFVPNTANIDTALLELLRRHSPIDDNETGQIVA